MGLKEITVPVDIIRKEKLEKAIAKEKGGKKIYEEKRQLNRREATACSAFALTWFQLIRLLYTMNITSTLYL